MANPLFETVIKHETLSLDSLFNVLGVPRYQNFSKNSSDSYDVQVRELKIKPAGWGLIGLVAIAAAISTTLFH